MVATPGPANSGRASSPPNRAGARYNTYRSTRPAWWNEWATLWSSLHQELHDPVPPQPVEDLSQLPAQLPGRLHRGVGRRPAQDHPGRLVVGSPEGRVLRWEPDGEGRVVHPDSARPHQHRVGLGPQPVGVEAGGGAGDPPAGAVGSGGAPVQ